MNELIVVQESDASKRLDLLIAKKTCITRSQVQKLLRTGNILVNNTSASQSYKVRTNDIITIKKSFDESETLVPEPLPINIFYMDDYLAVVDKPPDMVVYPCAGHERGTLLNAVYHRTGKLASIGGPLRNGIVHRLDKDTSGVMVVALDDKAYYGLVEQFKKREIAREYTALIDGNPKGEFGQIISRIGRSSSDRKKMSTRSRAGKEAITSWKAIRRFSGAALIEAKLGTGRTHQIRVHFASIGHPVLGDRVYGKKTFLLIGKEKISFPRQMLHASILGFNHPITANYLEFRSPLPEDFLDCISKLQDAG
jgi:23S rRNA pseudouridine1911/1915/1917 synthase